MNCELNKKNKQIFFIQQVILIYLYANIFAYIYMYVQLVLGKKRRE